MSQFGRRIPTDWGHIDKYPLRALSTPPIGAPVVLGINWYSNFDDPVLLDETYWIGTGRLGYIEGGHAICAKPFEVSDAVGWWDFYDQGNVGACVGFSEARMMTLLNRKKYNAMKLYNAAQEIDEYNDTPPEEGTSVRAGLEVLRTEGLSVVSRFGESDEKLIEGISTYRWATSWDEVRAALGVPDNLPGVPLLNSWGYGYPHKVRITDEAGAYLLEEEDGEAAIITDR